LALAIGKLVHDYKIPVKLSLVGPWPDSRYQKKVKQLIAKLNIENNVTIDGFVSKERLHRYYAESKIFCLMSRCESFGIPAVEAQAFGTPVVCSNCCSIPEVCGEGGIYLAPDDYEGTAQAIARLLAEEGKWEALSEAARKNASKYRWDVCSRPLLQMFDIIADRIKL
jgi:glycosyltransferase involved in cell wall biosynthesis